MSMALYVTVSLIVVCFHVFFPLYLWLWLFLCLGFGLGSFQGLYSPISILTTIHDDLCGHICCSSKLLCHCFVYIFNARTMDDVRTYTLYRSFPCSTPTCYELCYSDPFHPLLLPHDHYAHAHARMLPSSTSYKNKICCDMYIRRPSRS